jgi:hypothetical protein
MNNNKKVLQICILVFLFLVLFLIPKVSSLGITPGKTTLNFEKNLEKEIEITVLNNEHKSMKVLIMSRMEGELNSSITLFQDSLMFLPSEDKKNLKFKVKLPPEMSPGLHKGEIVALELPRSETDSDSIGATIAVVSLLHVYVSCPGKCIDADLTVLDSEQNSTATFIIPVLSRGKLGIGEVRAVIDIYSFNDKITTLETDYSSLASGERTEISAKWFVNVSTGDYRAKVTVLYDGETYNFEKLFTVGVKAVSIESILVNNFQLGEIAKLQILVENKWNKDIPGAYANLLVYDKGNEVMADIKSSTELLPSMAKKELIAYWDTVGVSEGEYSGKILVKYGQQTTDNNLVLKVSENSLDIFGVGYAIRPKSSNKASNITTILLVLVIILLVVNLSWFVFFKRFIGKKK